MTTDIPQRNLRNNISTFGLTFLKPKLRTFFLAFIWGLFSSIIFAPVEFTPLVWIILLPLIFTNRLTFGVGFWFGFGHFYANLFWLRTIHPAVVFPLAGYCAIYSGLWLSCFRRTQNRINSPLIRIVIASAIWIMFDWIRGSFLTGFPWNFLGITQWQNPNVGLIRLAGVYGETFLIIFTNCVLFELLKAVKQKTFEPKNIKSYIPLMASIGLFITVFGLNRSVEFDKIDGVLKVLPAQGNIPLCRDYTEEQFLHARDTYFNLTRAGVKAEKPDLVVWPETAVPASLRYKRNYIYPFLTLVRDMHVPFLIGNVDYRSNPDKPFSMERLCYNSAMYFSNEGTNTRTYDKTHPVPFGEFVPLGDTFPQLNEMLGMGRNLTAGTEFTVFDQHAPAYFGVNICYEDVFPEISRKFVLSGANIVMTITNDAWYHETVGSRQHFAHSVFRAIENNVHFLRSGNRSYTSITSPSGERLNCYKGDDGEIFIDKAELLEIPYSNEVTKTFYTKHGDVFAKICTFISILAMLFFICCWYHQKCRLLQKIEGVEDSS